jgi:hypothetical protein
MVSAHGTDACLAIVQPITGQGGQSILWRFGLDEKTSYTIPEKGWFRYWQFEAVVVPAP